MIRPFVPSDKAYIIPILRKVCGKEWEPEWFEPSLKFLDKDCPKFVAEHNGNITGFIAFSDYPPIIQIEMLVVKEGFRGNGIGSSLIKEAEIFAKKKGIKIIRVDTGAVNEGLEFYIKNGFKKIGEAKGYWLEGDHQVILSKTVD